MNTQVTAEIRDLDELAVAVTAGVGFFACVEPHMGFEVMVAGKALVALTTLKRFLWGMGKLEENCKNKEKF